MKTYSAQELYNLLIQADESVWIEAKGDGDTNQSLMESVCSFSNEPGLGGGYILYGIYENKEATGRERFIIEELADCDKIQSDISTQCASMFNIVAREIGAVDTLTYSQLTGEKTELAEKSLEELEKTNVLIRKGKTLEATYYVLNKDYSELIPQDNPPSKPLIPQDNPVGNDVIPKDLQERIDNLGQRAKKDVVKQIVLDLCKLKPRTKKELAEILGKREDHIQKEYLSEMLGKEIEYTLPDTPSSRNQAYKVIN